MTSQNPQALSKSTSIINHPFIWGNIAFIAGVPWLLTLSMAGLAVGDPIFPTWLEIFLLGFPAIALTVWVQWQQPLSPFSLWFIAKPPESLSEDERRVLTLIKQQQNGWYVTGWIAIAMAIVMSGIFCKLYFIAPLAQAIAPFPAGLRLFGIVWAEVCFLASNILLQAGITALRIKLSTDSELRSLQPFAIDKIKNNFTSIGWRSPQLLKFFVEDPIVADITAQEPPKVATEDNKVEESQAISEESQELVQELVISEAEAIDLVEESVTDTSLETDETNLEDLEGLENSDLENLENSENLEVDSFTEEIVSEEEVITPSEEAIAELTTDSVIEINEDFDATIIDPLIVDEIIEQSNIEVEAFLENNNESPEAIIEDITESPEDLIVDESIVDESFEAIADANIAESESTIEVSEETTIGNIDKVDEIVGETQDFEVSNPIQATEVVEIQDLEVSNPIKETEADLKVNLDEHLLDLDTDEGSKEITQSNNAEIDVHLESPEIEVVVEQEIIDTEPLEMTPLESISQESEIETNIDVDLNPKSQKKSTNLFGKSRKKGFAHKNHGFGKPIKTEINNEIATFNLEQVEQVESNISKEEPEQEVSNFVVEESIQCLLESSDIDLARASESQSSNLDLQNALNIDDDEELDEKIAFNNYVENILQEYLEDSTKENQEVESIIEIASVSEQASDIAKQVLINEELENANSENQEVDSITEITLVSEQASDIAEDVLLNEAISEAAIPEPIDLPIEFEPPVEAIAPSSETNQQISEDNSSIHKDPKYLVQEFLVDKFLARLEELNNADKTIPKANIELNIEEISEDAVSSLSNEKSESEQDEFADLEALLNRNKPSENQE